MHCFYGERLSSLALEYFPQSWITTHYRLSTAAYLEYQLFSVPPIATLSFIRVIRAFNAALRGPFCQINHE
jgi:hypothetical protein